MKYKLVKYPEIEEYLENLDPEEVFYDDKKNVWFVPEEMDPDYLELKKVKENVFKSLMEGMEYAME